MYYQILLGLIVSQADTVFLTEHDVLYHPSHFDFDPPDRNIYYYNVNVWRWEYPGDKAITYNTIHSLSGLCADRKLLLKHMLRRIQLIEDQGLDQHQSREPQWARQMGYEPGTKKRRRGGPTDETYGDYESEYPDIDIRHPGTYSPGKTRLSEFKHPPDPDNWHEIHIDQIPGWENVKGRFV
jgi:hypothetical protein